MRKFNKIIKVSFVILIILVFSILSIIILSISNKDSLVNSINKKELEGSITFVSNRTDKRKELNLLIEKFKELYPKVNINLELIGDPEEILRRKAAVGELPDVTLVPTAINVSEYNNYFLPLDELGFSEDNINNYNVGVGSDGKLYALTNSLAWQGVIYNKEIFEEAGIQEIPRNEKEFFEVCKKIKNIGIIPIALDYRDQWTMNIWVDTIPYLLDPNLEKRLIEKSKDILDYESSVYKSLEFARRIADNGYCENDFFNYDWQEYKNDIKDKKIAMFICNSDFIYQLEDMGMSENELAMFPIPDSKFIDVEGDCKFAISKSTKYPEISKEFLKFLFEEDRYSKAVNIMSALKTSEANNKMLKGLEKFNLPIYMQDDVLKKQTNNDIKIHNKYYNIRKSIGLDGSFTQKYIISKDIEVLRKEINEKWKKYREKIQ